MSTVRFTRHRKRFFPALAECQIDARNVAEVLVELFAAAVDRHAWLVPAVSATA